MTEWNQPSRLVAALLETAGDMRCAGVMSADVHEKITLRHLGDKADATLAIRSAKGCGGLG